MSLETTTNKVICQGNAATTTFSYSFIIPTADDAVVTFTDDEGTQTILVPAQYTITGLDDPNGGTITYPLAGSPMASGESLTLQRVVSYTQPTVLTNQGNFYPDVVEGADDYIVMQTQQLAENLARAIRFPAVDPAANAVATLPAWQERADKIFGFDSSGNSQVTDPAGGSPTSSANVNFVQALAGAVSMTLQARGRLELYLEDFGAVGDYDWAAGTGTDDSVAIQLAIDTVGPLGGAILHASRGKKYKISQVTCNWSHVIIQGEDASFDYTNEGFDAPAHANLKPSCALVCTTGVFGIHFRADEGATSASGIGRMSGLRNIAVVCPNAAASAIEYGVVSSTGQGIHDNVAIIGFQYGYTGFYQNMSLVRRVAAMNCTKIGFLIASAPGATRIISAYQHPNLNAYLQDNLSSSTIYFLEKIVARSNFIGVAVMNAESAKISGTIESNRGPGLICFKKTDQTFNGLEVDVYFENNFSSYTGSNAAAYEIDGSIAYSPTAPGAITALRTSAVPTYLNGSSSGEWSNAGDDIGPAIWIGSETESSVVQHIANAKHPYGIIIKNAIHCIGANQRALYARSSENMQINDVITSNGSATDLIVLDGGTGFSLYTRISNMTFDGTGATFETDVVEAGLLGGTNTYVTRPNLDITQPGGIVVLQGFAGNSADAFTGTFAVGVSGAPTGTVQWSRAGNMMNLYVPAFTGTSSGTSKTITGLPAALWPQGARGSPCAWTQDNGGAFVMSTVIVATNGNIDIFNGRGNFTGSGTYSNDAFSITYPIVTY